MTEPATPYRVLARKYRPQSFAEVIGQDALVRTLSNAIQTGRIAHAFILTGVRGVGKTTTARIIARALNCVGPDGQGGPTISPCGECVHCRSIAEDRHVDVIEMDAASRTGVDDIRDLTEGVRYRPVSARYKVYIIDEVHMLSKNAFNALLKTLEEPPPDVIFIFATTEVQKVPVTVLSRCQRFSLRRVPVEQLVAHYRAIAEAEGVTIAPGALGLIARAADGSVRDGLSILDQAIALASGPIEEAAVRDMLGIADRGLVLDLFETVLKGDAAGALGQLDGMYQGGADPLVVLQDLLDLCHFVTRLKLVPQAGADDPLEAGDRERVSLLAGRLSMPVLARAWQMLLKGIGEVQTAPSPNQAAEMILVRLAYVADLPAPAELVRSLTGSAPVAVPAATGGVAAAPAGRSAGSAAAIPAVGSPEASPVPMAALPQPGSVPTALAPALALVYEPMPQSFDEVVALFDRRNEVLLASHLRQHVHLVAFEPGCLAFRRAEGAPDNLAERIRQNLTEWTGERWLVDGKRNDPGAPTLRQREEQRELERKSAVETHPLVRAALDAFPGATIAAVRERFAAAEPGSDAAEDETGSSDDEIGSGEDEE
jgi:DNA polymerase-3 subunit gamma/tau